MSDDQNNGGNGNDAVPEFARFLRNMGVQALDNFANRLSQKDVNAENSPKPVRKIAEHWMSLSKEQKSEFVGKILTTAEAVAAAAPAAIVALKSKAASSRAKKEADTKSKADDEKRPKKAKSSDEKKKKSETKAKSPDEKKEKKQKKK